jgi:hypothetical protein
MAASDGRLKDVARRHYDRLVAAAVLLGLLGSLAYLAMSVRRIQVEQHLFDDEIRRLRPRYETATVFDEGQCTALQARIAEPFRVDEGRWTNSLMFVPEARVVCFFCWRPIEYVAPVCPHCLAEQPPPDGTPADGDSDKDGMPDKWEKEYGFDPLDPSDAARDADGDGFSNAAEYAAQTDPTDPASHPPLVEQLFVKQIVAHPFPLQYRSRVTSTNGRQRYGVNTRGGRTYMVGIGDEVDGFKVIAYEEKFEASKEGPKRRIDVSVLTLQRGDKTIHLVMDVEHSHVEYEIALWFALDDVTIKAELGKEFRVREQVYRLLEVDSAEQSALIQAAPDGERTLIRKRSDPPITKQEERENVVAPARAPGGDVSK